MTRPPVVSTPSGVERSPIPETLAPRKPPIANGAQVYLKAAPGLGLWTLCLVVNVKVIGRVRYLQVVPYNGKGYAWIPASEVEEKGGN